jgi:DNA repair exonuclease SbcCD nuclease subunit
MAKIIHASDFCLGRQFSGIGRAGDFVRKALKESLENAVTLALDRSVDLFLVSGNLFAGNMVSLHLVDFTMQQIGRLGKIPFVIVPGTRDCFNENSVYRYFTSDNQPENLHLLNNRHSSSLSLGDADIHIYGVGCVGEETNWMAVPLPSKNDLPGLHLVALCNRELNGSPTEDIAMEREITGLAKAGFDYIAVGGSEFRRWSEQAYSSGSPEAQNFEDQETGQVLIVDVNPGQLNVEQVRIGQLTWKDLELDSARFRYSIELEEEMLKHSSPQTLLRIRFGGQLQSDGFVDLQALERDFAGKFCGLRIDETRSFASGNAPATNVGGDALLADYISLLDDAIDKTTPDLRPRYLQALATGSAMLSGKDVIS